MSSSHPAGKSVGEQGFKLRSSWQHACHYPTWTPGETNVGVSGPLILQIPSPWEGPLPAHPSRSLNRSWSSSFTVGYKCSITTLKVFAFSPMFSTWNWRDLVLRGNAGICREWQKERLSDSLWPTPGSARGFPCSWIPLNMSVCDVPCRVQQHLLAN